MMKTHLDQLEEGFPDFLQSLSAREKSIVVRRFGLNGNSKETLKEVGQTFGVTSERIRQLQNIALAKLRRWLRHNEDKAPQVMRLADLDQKLV